MKLTYTLFLVIYEKGGKYGVSDLWIMGPNVQTHFFLLLLTIETTNVSLKIFFISPNIPFHEKDIDISRKNSFSFTHMAINLFHNLYQYYPAYSNLTSKAFIHQN